MFPFFCICNICTLLLLNVFVHFRVSQVNTLSRRCRLCVFCKWKIIEIKAVACIYESTFQELEKQDKTHHFSYQYIIFSFNFFFLCIALLSRVLLDAAILQTQFFSWLIIIILLFLTFSDAPLLLPLKQVFHVSFLRRLIEICFIHFC